MNEGSTNKSEMIPEDEVVERQKPEYDIVKRAAVLEKKTELATKTDVKRMASRIQNDEKNAPDTNKIKPKPKAK